MGSGRASLGTAGVRPGIEEGAGAAVSSSRLQSIASTYRPSGLRRRTSVVRGRRVTIVRMPVQRSVAASAPRSKRDSLHLTWRTADALSRSLLRQPPGRRSDYNRLFLPRQRANIASKRAGGLEARRELIDETSGEAQPDLVL